jgi:uncharacterized protein YcfJ
MTPGAPAGEELIMNGTIIAALPFAIMFGIVGYRVGIGRGRRVLGAVLGFALGLIGLGIFMLIPRTAEAQARHDRERAERQQPGQPAENQDIVR